MAWQYVGVGWRCRAGRVWAQGEHASLVMNGKKTDECHKCLWLKQTDVRGMSRAASCFMAQIETKNQMKCFAFHVQPLNILFTVIFFSCSFGFAFAFAFSLADEQMELEACSVRYVSFCLLALC